MTFILHIGLLIFHITFANSIIDRFISDLLQYCCIIHFYCYVFIYCVFYYNYIKQQEDSIQMILDIQKAFRTINYKYDTMFTIWSWINIILYFLLYVAVVFIMPDYKMAGFLYTLLYFDVGNVYGMRVIALIRSGLKTWISQVKYYSKVISELTEEDYGVTLIKLFDAYVDLKKAFDTSKKSFQLSVSVGEQSFGTNGPAQPE